MPDNSSGIDAQDAAQHFRGAVETWLGAPISPLVDNETATGLIRQAYRCAGEQWAAAVNHMLMGASRRMATTRAGLHPVTVTNTLKADSQLAGIVIYAEQIGAGLFEQELMRRALAGPGDRGSIRALELVAKSRMPEYRDKHQQEITVRHQADESMRSVIDGWQQQP